MNRWYNIDKESRLNIAKRKKYRNVFILDEIGGYGVYASEFIKELVTIDADVINLHIDSPGGSITDGIAIYNALRAHPAQVDVYIDGFAGSIASIVILAGDNIYIPENASVFTHLPMMGFMEMPNREDLQEAQDVLGRFETVLANIYSKHTGQDTETVTRWMTEDTWFFGQEAVDAGFATEVVDKVALVAQYDINKYSFSASIPQAESDDKQETEVINMNDEVIADATEEVVEAPVEETAEEVVEETVEEASADLEESVEEAEIEEVEDEEYEEEEEADAEEVLALEQERKDSILALSEKYNQDGSLNQQVIEALAGDVSAEEFKNTVMDYLVSKPTAKKIIDKTSDVETVSSLREQLKTASAQEKFNISQKLAELRFK